MKLIDIILLVIILGGAIQGFRSGFIVELFSLLGVLLGVLGGFKLMGFAMVMLTRRFNIDEKVLPYVAFAVVFLVIVIVVGLLGRMIKESVKQTMLGGADQMAELRRLARGLRSQAAEPSGLKPQSIPFSQQGRSRLIGVQDLPIGRDDHNAWNATHPVEGLHQHGPFGRRVSQCDMRSHGHA